MGALFTCCRKPPKSPSGSSANVGVINEELNIRNGEVVIESRTESSQKYEYKDKGDTTTLDRGKGDFDDGADVEEVMEATTQRRVESAPPPRPESPSTHRQVTETVTASKDASGRETVKKTTIVRETTETRTVASSQRSSIPMLKPTPEGKPKPKVVIVREYN